jgi:hypothetical protein
MAMSSMNALGNLLSLEECQLGQVLEIAKDALCHQA